MLLVVLGGVAVLLLFCMVSVGIGGFLLVRRLGLFGGARPDPQWGVRGIMGPAIMNIMHLH